MTKYRNPYLEVFGKYVERAHSASWFDQWQPREGNLATFAVQHTAANFTSRFDAITNTYTVKHELQFRCAYAVPNDEALDAIAQLGMPVVEIGAGTGYWMWMLNQAGVPTVGFDHKPTVNNRYCSDDHWAEVQEGDHLVLQDGAYSDHALMLCWPPYDNPMASKCLRTYAGEVLIYVGEPAGGCTAGDSFFKELDAHWEPVIEVDIPQWPGIHDYLGIFRRDSR